MTQGSRRRAVLLSLLAFGQRGRSHADRVDFECGEERERCRLIGEIRSVGGASGAASAAVGDDVTASRDPVAFSGYLVAPIGDLGAVGRCRVRLLWGDSPAGRGSRSRLPVHVVGSWLGSFPKLAIQKFMISGRSFFILVTRGLVTFAPLLVAVAPRPVLLVEDLIAELHERRRQPDREGLWTRFFAA